LWEVSGLVALPETRSETRPELYTGPFQTAERRGYDCVMECDKPVLSLLLGCLLTIRCFAQVRPPQYPPPDIIPPEVLKTRDALQVDPGHYRLEFENDKMRVLRLTLKPSETVPMHDDKDALAVCLKECHIRFTAPNGRSEDIHMEPGASRWIYGETRSEKNLGTNPSRCCSWKRRASVQHHLLSGCS
jgi:beta-alanine degradation protein BauB